MIKEPRDVIREDGGFSYAQADAILKVLDRAGYDIVPKNAEAEKDTAPDVPSDAKTF